LINPKEFKKMVENLIEVLLAELGINHEIFGEACETASCTEYKSVIDQIVALDNFLYFKKMMVARNIKLNEEALK
jgi:hypothetical protein